MTWTGPRCPHCGRAMNAWGRACCDCAKGNNNDEKEGDRECRERE